ncbi:MAG: hypothetical protein KGL39_19775 [Patescibacteria group bacterium]|nr:hypothetical protein [Patescibacteria group bacterium]
MDFTTWKRAVLQDWQDIGFNKTYQKYGLSSAALRNIINGGPKTGYLSWQRLGKNMRLKKIQEQEKTA